MSALVVGNAQKKLGLLREILVEKGLDGFVVGSGDAHSSEYVPEFAMRRTFISDFTGSAGTVLVTRDKALCWTDGRYFLQASQELESSCWTLMRSGEPGVLELNEWIVANMPENSVVGVDGFLMTDSQAVAMNGALKGKGIALKMVEGGNPVDAVWNALGKQPAAPSAAVTVNAKFAGQSHEEKIAAIQLKLKSTPKSPSCFVVSMLDEIVWLFNIRGADVDYNPVVLAYAVVLAVGGAHLFIDASKLSKEAVEHLGPSVTLHPYEDVETFLRTYTSQTPGAVVGVDPSQLNWRLCRSLGPSAIHHMVSPLTLAKAIKNPVELDGIRAAHVRDGVALTAFLHWLETTVKAKPLSITEYDVAVKIEEFRGKMSMHVCPSFPTIAGYGPNGAIIHYKPEKDTAAAIGTDGLFLLDSGAQYQDGTTDVTRTLFFGAPASAPQRVKDCYTLVLKGHIALARAVFPETTLGSRLDALARTALWTAGLDYNHGTGHGVGAFLNVHEGPQGIGFRKRDNEVGFFIGMTTSNEPGYYEENAFGIRIENVCITVNANTPNKFGGKEFCALETVTMAPIKTSILNLDLLDDAEIAWLNTYHEKVRNALEPLIKKSFPEALDYLITETQHVRR